MQVNKLGGKLATATLCIAFVQSAMDEDWPRPDMGKLIATSASARLKGPAAAV